MSAEPRRPAPTAPRRITGSVLANAAFAARLLALVALVWGAAAAAAPYLRARDRSEPASAGRCRPLAAVPGPEDLELQLDWPRGPRVLVSSDDRRHPERRGAIWAVPLDRADGRQPAPRAAALPLLGRDHCSFHPHGISLVKRESGELRLYVINHHEARDWRSDSGCLAGAARPERARKFSSVEIFVVEDGGLRFLSRLGDAAVLPNPNDLVALPDGRIFATNPATGLAMLREIIEEVNHGSSVASYAEDRDECPSGSGEGPWCNLPLDPHGAYANGIAFEETPAGAEVLYVASNGSGEILALPLGPSGVEATPVNEGRLSRGGPDNLLWKSPGERVLVAAVHPNLRRFVQHALDPRVPSASEVWELDLASGEPRQLFVDDGGVISAASVAAFVRSPAGDSLILGQVFGRHLIQCRLPGTTTATPEGAP